MQWYCDESIFPFIPINLNKIDLIVKKGTAVANIC